MRHPISLRSIKTLFISAAVFLWFNGFFAGDSHSASVAKPTDESVNPPNVLFLAIDDLNDGAQRN